MPFTRGGALTRRTALRLWPGVAIVAVQWLGGFGLPLVAPDQGGTGVLVWAAGGLAVLLWWLFFSRAPWLDRLAAPVVMVLAFLATQPLLHESIAGGGMGMLPVLLAIPTLSLGLVGWAAVSRGLPPGARLGTLAISMLLACSVWALARTVGMHGDGFDLEWRWTATPEERLLAEGHDLPLASEAPASALAPPEAPAPAVTVGEPAAADPGEAPPTSSPPAPASSAPATAGEAPAAPPTTSPTMTPEWPGFRGPRRDGVVPDTRIATDWATSPPREIWRRPIGPGWSSFAVDGHRIYTQEQRGEHEIVACYDASTGEPVWAHRDPARFWESNGGAGPRATPTIHDDRVYTLGGTGILNALDARSGAVAWTRNAVEDAEKKVPYWGFAGSPLVVDDLVIVAASGRLVAYDRTTGTRRWLGPDGGTSYSSPHLVTIDGEPQVVLLHAGGATSVAPADGTVLWQNAWDGGAIVQPAALADGDLLISTNSMTGGNGLRRISLAQRPGDWAVQERWTSPGLKPYFNDFVVHEGHAYGFDGSILACIDLEDGARRWKGGRYGKGQLVLLQDQSLLLVLSEDGELALVSATPDKYTEIAKVPALDGKTWNHPVVVKDVLLVRNGEEMAAFRLPRAGR
jgi:outer membrane protein assembly factor BamB